MGCLSSKDTGRNHGGSENNDFQVGSSGAMAMTQTVAAPKLEAVFPQVELQRAYELLMDLSALSSMPEDIIKLVVTYLAHGR